MENTSSEVYRIEKEQEEEDERRGGEDRARNFIATREI